MVNLVTGCGFLLGETTDEETDASGQPSLSAGDFPEVPPCSNRDILPSDETFLETIEDATEMIHVHKVYTTDAELPAVCGLASADNNLPDGEIGWDPSVGTNVVTCHSFDEDLSDFLESPSAAYYPGICRSGFGFESEVDTVDGFPRGGTYRMDLCIESGRKSYSIRFRVNVSGEHVNRTWNSIDISRAGDLEIFDPEGSQLLTVADLKILFIENPGGATFTVRSEEGTKTHVTVSARAVCVVSTSEACPTPTEGEACE